MSPKSRKRKRAKRRASASKSSSEKKKGFSYRLAPPLLASVPKEERLAAVGKMAQHYETKFRDSFEELQKLITTMDPFMQLSCLSFYSLFSRPDRNPEFTRDKPILQHHVELLQALILRKNLEDYDTKPLLPPDHESLRELLQVTGTAFHMRRFSQYKASMSEQELRHVRAIEQMRVHTQAVRNWGYPHQISEIISRLFSPLNEEFKASKGIGACELVKMTYGLVDQVEERANNHIRRMRPVLRSNTLSELVTSYNDAFPELATPADEMLRSFQEMNVPVENAKAILLSHSDLFIPDMFMFTLNDFIKAYPDSIREDSLVDALESWSLPLGALKDFDPDHFFLANPIWTKPIIKLPPDKTYFVPIPGLFISFCVELLEELLDDIPELRKKYEKRRGNFLEQEIERLFSTAFPSSSVMRGSLWVDPSSGKQFENDLLVLVDSFLIVAEAKSHKITDKARRGHGPRLEKTVRELLVEPSNQAARFANYLQSNPGKHVFQTKRGEVNELDNSQVARTIRLNVTLDLLANLTGPWTELRSAGFISSQSEIGPTMTLADLMSVFEILESACEKIHYLARRSELEANASYFADELDLLAFYLDTGFNIGDVEFSDTLLHLMPLANKLDQYFSNYWLDYGFPKPRPRRTKWWNEILRRIEEQPSVRWTEFGYVLLNVPYEDQQKLIQRFHSMKQSVEQKWHSDENPNSVILHTGPPQRRSVIACVAYKDKTRRERDKIFENVAMSALENQPADRALVIGVNVANPKEPYNVLSCVILGDRPAESQSN
jgi:hypothetical protein